MLFQEEKALCPLEETLFQQEKALRPLEETLSTKIPRKYPKRKQTTAPPDRRTIMATTTKSIHRSTVTLLLPKSVPALIVYAQGIVKRMTGNVSFSSPTPTLDAVTTAIDGLQAAETAALARTKGAAAARNEKRAALIALLQQLRAYIQARADADPTNGASVIESAGVAVRKTATHRARAFAAKPGPVSGVATLVSASAARRASYEWQYSIDAGKTWVTAPATLQAKTKVSGLQPGATVYFKYRSVTKTGEGDWSQPVSLMVS
jgi:hypothetical protein